VEGAILGAVGVSGARTRILTGGPAGEAAAADLTSAGLRVSFYNAEIGKASTFKMLRGIFSKGLEALLIELLVSGKRVGIEQDLWDDINELMTKNRFEDVARNWIETHPGACERRYHEVSQIVETMQQAGIEPVMTSATERFFARSTELSLAARCVGRKPSSDELISVLEGVLRGTPAAS
jgi:3-hydroxyisobutyrate dehydrogenase-like beta-hydroxyacid dehydrogenase